MSGIPLRLLTEALDGTDDDGLWSSSSLPAGPVRVLAWRDVSSWSIESGAYDSAATQLNWPWPRVVELQPVD